MEVHYKWPMLCALTISGVVSVSGTGIALLRGVRMGDAATLGGMLFLALFAVLTLVVLPLGAWGWVWATKRQTPGPQPRPHPKPKGYPVPMKTKGGRPRETHQDKVDRAFKRAGDWLRKRGKQLESAPPPRRLQGKYAQSVSPVQAWMESPEVSLMAKIYEITHQFYGKKVKREDFRIFGEGWQELYADYKHWVSDSGLGWVDLNGKKTITSWRYPEHELYQSDRMLERIARQNGFRFPGEE